MSEKTNNKWCPVMPDKLAKAKHAVEYKGVTIHLCCSNCMDDFTAAPALYVKQLPEALQSELGLAQQKGNITNFRKAESAGESLKIVEPYQLGGLPQQTLIVSSGILLIAVAGLAILAARSERMSKARAVRLGLATLLLCLVANLAAYSVDLRANLHHSQKAVDHRLLMDSLHYAAYYEFGNPLRVPNDKTDNSLACTYYRGNDERSAELFNHGFYRTCTFKLSLVDEKGTAIKPQDKIADKTLFIKVDIIRAPHTPDHFYANSLMSKIFLTSDSSPFFEDNVLPDDALRFTASDDDQFFTASYRLAKPPHSMNGENTVYIREERYAGDDKLGSRVHYAIELKLKLDAEQTILPASNLWMGATYRTRRLRNWEISPDEWLSLKPIPEVPAPQDDLDNDTLGITEQEKGAPGAP